MNSVEAQAEITRYLAEKVMELKTIVEFDGNDIIVWILDRDKYGERQKIFTPLTDLNQCRDVANVASRKNCLFWSIENGPLASCVFVNEIIDTYEHGQEALALGICLYLALGGDKTTAEIARGE